MLLCFSGFFQSVSGQEIVEANNYLQLFNQNLESLSYVETGKNVAFQFAGQVNFENEFKKSESKIFPVLLPESVAKFRYLQDLSQEKKKKLLLQFFVYENEIEKILVKNNVPSELKYLPVALSAMNNLSVNQKKAGAWQLTHFQAVLQGLNINNLVDERFNTILSAHAAAKEIAHNYNLFADYNLAVYAFLIGRTGLKNLLVEIENKNPKPEIAHLIPKNNRETIALFQALLVFFSSNKIMLKTEPFSKKINPDTVFLNRLIHFKQIEKVLQISESTLAGLNPQYKYHIVPGDKQIHWLVLPAGKWDDFVLWQDSIYNVFDSVYFELVAQRIEYPPAPNRQYLGEPVKDLEIEGKTKIKYRIKTGDVLGIISENYDVRVADLKYWNNIYNERKIQAGQTLDIFVDNEMVDFYQNHENKNQSETKPQQVVSQIKNAASLNIFKELEQNSRKIEHVVKSGESPFVIAKQYDGVTPEAILEWNNIDDPRKIQIGQKLIIYIEK